METEMQFQSSKDLKYIVNQINHVLGKNLTIVAFDELCKKPKEIKRLFNEIIYKMSAEKKFLIPQQNNRDLVRRQKNSLLAFFFSILGVIKKDDYFFSKKQEFYDGIIGGDEQVILPVMYRIVKDFNQLKVRVYLSTYLQKLPVPSEFVQDEVIADLLQKFNKIKQEFKVVHKQSLKKENVVQDPKIVAERLRKLQMQKLNLEKKTVDTEKDLKRTRPNDFNELINIATQLVNEEVLLKEIGESYRNQKTELNNKLEMLEIEKQKLHNVQKKYGESQTLSDVIGSLENEVERKQQYFMDDISIQLAEIESQIKGIQIIRDKPINLVIDELETEFRQLTRELDQVNREIKEIENRPVKEDTELSSAKRTFTIYTNKKKEKEVVLKKLVRNYKEYESAEDIVEKELQKYKGETIPTSEEFNEYKQKLMEKIKKTKIMKKKLSVYSNEIVILKQTLEILKTKHPQGEEELQKLLKMQNIQNYNEKVVEGATQIQKVQKKKQKTLEELQGILIELEGKIEQAKEKHKPAIEIQKKLTLESQELEEIYSGKREIYESTKTHLENAKGNLEIELIKLKESGDNFESIYHATNAKQMVLNVNLSLLKDEEKYQKGEDKYSQEFKTRMELFKHELKKLQEKHKQLSLDQKNVQLKYQPNMEQIDMFKSLCLLLECKINIHKSPSQKETTSPAHMFEKSQNKDGIDTFDLNSY